MKSNRDKEIAEAERSSLAQFTEPSGNTVTWVNIDRDGPPPNGGYYLVHMDSGLITVTFFTYNHQHFDKFHNALSAESMDIAYGRWSKHFEHSRVYGYRVTHWAPLPDPPK